MVVNELIGGRFAPLRSDPRKGGGGEIVRAVDLADNGAQVAVKFIKGHRDDPTTRIFFDREADSLSRLDHPNIVRFIDAGWHEQRAQFYIALAWVESDLDVKLSNPDWADWDDFAETYALPVLEALAHAHLKSVIHRDIKPLNILLDGSKPLLADFGIAKIRDQVETLGQTVLGWHTRPYAPPDSCVGYEYTRDVWAVGVVIVECMSDRRIGDYPEIDQRLSEIPVPPEVRSLLRSCVDLEPAGRPTNGAVLLQKMQDIQFERRSKAVSSGAVAWLGLTSKVRSELADAGGSSAESIIVGDLVDGCRAEYRYETAAARTDKETIFLYGKRRRYTSKIDNAKRQLVVVASREFDLYDGRRERICAVGHLVTFSTTDPGRKLADSGISTLLQALDQHDESFNSPTAVDVSESDANALLDRYLNTLYAREELERGDRRPLEYNSVSVNGQNVTFDLIDSSELDYTGQEWDIKVGRRRIFGRGVVVSHNSNSISLRLARLPKNIPTSGELSPYLGPSQRGHDRQIDAVSSIKDGSISKPEMARFLADPSLVAEPQARGIDKWFREDLDASKRKAVSAAIGSSDLLVVEGPPGTGKTSFITEVVAQTLRLQPEAKILIVSQTHVAVDNALERLVDAGIENVIRLSKPEDPKVSASVQHLILDRKMAEWAKDVQRRAESRIASMASKQGMPLRHLKAALCLQKLTVVLGDIEYLEEREGARTDPETIRSETVRGVSQLRDREELQQRLSSLLEEALELRQEAGDLLDGDLPIDSAIDRQSAGTAVELLLGQGQYSLQLLGLVALQGEWLQRVATDRNLVTAFLDTGSVLAGTCIGFLGHPAVRDLEFDLCILDEASKATATEALVPLAKAKKWILVGDTRQLPPLDEELLWNKSMLSKFDLDTEFVRETLFDRLVKYVTPGAKYLLREQYRMIRPIGDLISSTFYGGELVSPNRDTIPGLEKIGKPVLWISTSGLGKARFEEKSGQGITSHSNRTEAKIAIDRLATLNSAIEKGLVCPPNGRKMSVLLIAPYRLQMDEMERRLSSVDLGYLDISVQSVDAVQGREADMTVFTITRSNNRGDLGFLRQEYWRRINVALSRARFSLTLIGDIEFCLDQPSGLRDVALYIRRNGSDCEVRDV